MRRNTSALAMHATLWSLHATRHAPCDDSHSAPADKQPPALSHAFAFTTHQQRLPSTTRQVAPQAPTPSRIAPLAKFLLFSNTPLTLLISAFKPLTTSLSSVIFPLASGLLVPPDPALVVEL